MIFVTINYRKRNLILINAFYYMGYTDNTLMKTINGVMCHWESNIQLSAEYVLSMAVNDYACKCAHIIREYSNPLETNIRFSTGIYQIFKKRWGLDGFVDRGYKKIGMYGGDNDRNYYGFFDKFYSWYQKFGDDYSKEQIEEKLIGFLGGGETPFITVAEYHHPNSVSYEYIYYLTR